MSSSNVHLVVLHNGLWGSAENLSYLTTALAKAHGATVSPRSKLQVPESVETINVHAADHPNAVRKDLRLVVLNSAVNQNDLTYDGIDWCGERLIKEIYEEVARLESEEQATVIKFSMIGYSLGGLITRYAVGLLYAQGFFSSASSISKASTEPSSSAASTTTGNSLSTLKSRPKPSSFSTLATPHLGISPTTSTFSKVAGFVGSRSLGRSGKQLYLTDYGWTSNTQHAASSEETNADKGICLLEAMVDDRFSFLKGLCQFERIDIWANAIVDLTVPYRTAAFEEHDPFVVPGALHLVRDETHPSLLVSYQAVDSLPHKTFMQRVSRSLSPNNLPWLLNPQRYPFRFPLNYLAFLGLPILLPVMLSLVVHRLRSQSKISNKRVREFERLWALENGHLDQKDLQSTDNTDGPDDSSAKQDGRKAPKPKQLDRKTLDRIERTRFSQMLAMAEAEAEQTLRGVAEDNVSTITNHASQPSEAPTTPKYTTKPNTTTQSLSQSYHLDPNEQPLSSTQRRIAARLNDQRLLPQIKKHLVHFDDVVNAHPVIIVRSVTIEAHKKGNSAVQAFVQRFSL